MTSGGYQLSLRWSGEPITSAYMSTSLSGYGWVYFVGSIYYVFGRNQLLVQLLNGLMGGLTVLVIYSIAARLFDRAAARWAALFMAFFPQMVFWSTGMYKDPAILLCIAVAMFAVLRLRDSLSVSPMVMFVVAEVVLITLRFYIAYFVILAALATFVFGQRRGAVRMAVTYGVLGLLLFGALNVAVKRETLEQQTTYLTLERLQVTREDQAMWGRSGFGQEYDVSTPAGALATLPVGLVYLLFAPFPWTASGLRQALVVPETLVWYALMPAFVRGLRYGLKRQFGAILPITRVCGEPDARVRADAGQRRDGLPTANADQHVLFHIHGSWGGREAASAGDGRRGRCNAARRATPAMTGSRRLEQAC